MTLSIRARLTAWYSSIVVLVLVTAAIVGSLAQASLSLRRMDDDLARTMATLNGVMRTEFGEGLSLEGAAAAASLEVVAPNRALSLRRPDGSPLAAWGLSLDGAALPPLSGATLIEAAAPVRAVTVESPSGDFRMLGESIDYGGHRYVAVVIAPLAELHAEHAVMQRGLSFGILVGLIGAAAGGWVIGRQALKPLAEMAEQAGRVNERDPRERLITPHADDELGRLAAAFNGLLGRLAAALNLQRQFMADASHELRTPVSVVRTTAQVTLAREARSIEEYREALQIVGEQANRLSRLVDAMFLLSRAEAHGIPLQRDYVNLDDILADSARGFRVLAAERGVTVSTRGDEEIGLTGDDALLRQMVGNLLDNAIRHADVSGRVVAHVTRSRDQVQLRITNDGDGITDAIRERIFERFVRMGRSAGAGLGLPIARWIAEAHGGTLQLESSQPGCTTFVVRLPCDPVIDGSFAA